MTIAQALKTKKRITIRISEIDKIFKAENTVKEDVVRKDLAGLEKERQELVENLVSLKAKIGKANVPVLEQIYALSEAKAYLAFLNGLLPPVEAKSRYSYMEPKDSFIPAGSIVIKTVSYYTKERIDQLKKDVQASVDKLQEILDNFNFNTSLPE